MIVFVYILFFLFEQVLGILVAGGVNSIFQSLTQ